MDELTIEQIKYVFGWSTPTALKFAAKHGILKDETGRGKWYVPVSAVQDTVDKRAGEAQKTQLRLMSLGLKNGDA